MVNIPKWEDAAEAVKNESASPLDLFVYNNEPAGLQDVEFRTQLQALLDYVSGLTQRATDAACRCPDCGCEWPAYRLSCPCGMPRPHGRYNRNQISG
jgi:hypothetical protein